VVLLGSVKTGAMMIQMQMIFILVKVVWQRTRQTLITKVKIVTVNRHAPQASKGARVSHLLRVSIPKMSSYSNVSFASFVSCALVKLICLVASFTISDALLFVGFFRY
jgi:hypothetical protein